MKKEGLRDLSSVGSRLILITPPRSSTPSNPAPLKIIATDEASILCHPLEHLLLPW